MKIIGLTGSIGMGKSTAAMLLQHRLRLPLFDADKTAHFLTQPKIGKAIKPIKRAFPDCVENGMMDRKKLAKRIFQDEKAKKRLENILHPMIAQERQRFIHRQRVLGQKLVILDIPLLYEARLDKYCDKVICVYCSSWLQQNRVMQRTHMNLNLFREIKAKQMPSHIKQIKADYCVHSGLGIAATMQGLTAIIKPML